MAPTLSILLELRLLVGFLGERAQHGWWSTSFFGDYSMRSLEFVAPKTASLARYHGAVEAARRLHDEHLSVGKLTKQISVPLKLTSSADIDSLIQQLHGIKAQLSLYAEAEITIVVGETRG